ncbi:hypothetical protein D9619_013218 [Psilocybe cf. subviscida]|uniref:Uncharacterized protein n=1 Tax=Psilocybe cf. subviscida TaxID=2480587 RepID=A0A8H5B6R3_9AGAR|nr:hypothetical protein D9619_013218 [Psilocybe cf. subviscida]
MLAPFLDRMITRNIGKRFTALQALEFLNNIIASAAETQLSIQEDEDPSARKTGNYEVHDRWKGLPKDFQEKWDAYREPMGIPFSWKLLRALRGIRWLPEPLIPDIRRLTFKTKTYLKRN